MDGGIYELAVSLCVLVVDDDLSLNRFVEAVDFFAGFTGENDSKINSLTDFCLCIPSSNTARVQEGHILAIHIICKLIENKLLS